MGNTTVVASNVKAQGDSDVKKIYKQVDLKGGGELIELMKRARWTKNYKEVDEKIQTDVKRFLYNDGNGKKVPIVDYIVNRSKERNSTPKITKQKQDKDKELALIDMRFPDGQGNYLHNKPGKHGISLPASVPSTPVHGGLDRLGQQIKTDNHVLRMYVVIK